jgi:hypothetical protein
MNLLHSAVLFAVMAPPPTDEALPLVDRGDPARLQAHVATVVKSLQEVGTPLSEETTRKLRPLLTAQPATQAEALELQRLLDTHCLAGVTINPESRVKAARGPAEATLVRGERRAFLIKLQNDAGVTQPLAIESPQQLGRDGDARGERWLRAALHRRPPLTQKLTGGEVEYLILLCESDQVGKREAKLQFDVGQGTQDLGFRAEVPVLFTIKSRE